MFVFICCSVQPFHPIALRPDSRMGSDLLHGAQCSPILLESLGRLGLLVELVYDSVFFLPLAMSWGMTKHQTYENKNVLGGHETPRSAKRSM